MAQRTAELTCNGCGSTYEVEYRRRNRRKFCTYTCAMKHLANEARETGRFRGERNPMWKGGVSSDNVRYKNRFRERWPIKAAAHDAVTNAMRRGEIERRPCERCGEDKSAAHHDDYAKPLEVRWLCKPCHTEWHNRHEPLNGGTPQLGYVHPNDSRNPTRPPKE